MPYGKVKDSRSGKTFYVSWERWLSVCKENNVDPYENEEIGFDLGGGDSYTVAVHPEEREERE